MPEISVILPVYNTGEILGKTIESILHQTFQDFELIIIDDGSTDNSYQICRKYSVKDKRIRVISQKNSGVCAARNKGIDLSEGKYITFCDHDDIYDKLILKTELELALKYKTDLTVVGARHVSDSGKSLCFNKQFYLKNQTEVKKNFFNLLKANTLGTVWNILYTRQSIGDVRFNTEYKKGHEDINFNLDLLSNVNGIYSSSKILYYHYVRKVMSTSAHSHVGSLKAMKDANNKIALFFKENKIVLGDQEVQYMDIQGEYLRTYAMTCIKCKVPLKEFQQRIQLLNINNVCLPHFKYKNKNIFVYHMCMREKYRRLYYALRIYSFMHRS